MSGARTEIDRGQQEGCALKKRKAPSSSAIRPTIHALAVYHARGIRASLPRISNGHTIALRLAGIRGMSVDFAA
jgi:hypothetical protein